MYEKCAKLIGNRRKIIEKWDSLGQISHFARSHFPHFSTASLPSPQGSLMNFATAELADWENGNFLTSQHWPIFRRVRTVARWEEEGEGKVLMWGWDSRRVTSRGYVCPARPWHARHPNECALPPNSTPSSSPGTLSTSTLYDCWPSMKFPLFRQTNGTITCPLPLQAPSWPATSKSKNPPLARDGPLKWPHRRVTVLNHNSRGHTKAWGNFARCARRAPGGLTSGRFLISKKKQTEVSGTRNFSLLV